MSLVVWLPLTKDTRQQGLSGINVTGSPASWGDGKLGKCATWNGAVANVLYNNTTDFNYTDNFSVAFWMSPNYTGSTAQFAWTVGRADAGGYGYGMQITGTNSASFRFGNGTYGVTAEANTWHHYTMTIGNSKVTIYKDGNQISSNNLPGTLPTYSDGNGIGLGCFHYSSNIYPFYGSLNDFRIYDHCLSPMEVKELAKGLILHYPLNRQGWGQENLVWNTHYDSMPSHWNNWGSPPTREIVEINGKRWLHVKASDRWQGYSQNQSNRNGVGEIAAGEQLVLSYWAYGAANYSSYPCIGIHWTDGSSILAQSWPQFNITTTPQKCVATVTVPSGVSAFNIMVGNGSGTSGNTNEVWVSEVKLEKGSVATPWCPNSSDTLAITMDLNGTTEYDCSGFCNNGTRTGTFSWTSDTPKYQVSIEFSGSQRIEAPWNPSGTTSFTIAGWFYNSSGTTYYGAKNTYNTYICLEQSRYFVYNSGASAYVGNYTSARNTWQHITLVHDATTMKLKLYINGSFVSEVTTNGTIYNSDILDIGGRQGAAQYNGKMSDFRIYATALSADDVLSLYQNSAYIDSSGNVYGAVHTEV